VTVTRSPGERTLLTSVLLSAPGPLVVGIGLFLGRSSTQLADFIRRTAELAAIVVSWAVFRSLHRDGDPDPARRARLEAIANTSVGVALCVSGAAMLVVALWSRPAAQGNVIPGLVIALLGVTTNSWFWWRYAHLNREHPQAILAGQRTLYRAKSLVDACVSTALLTVALAPGTTAARVMDTGGSLVVALYLLTTGASTLRSGRLSR